ncbi:MAG: 3-phosphoshikimate 1-carboxyvinyltransferase [Bacteroidaceae bacterium]|nr:3-phosphoshikimate 1-carboxyvinyltransferase [Bacteroidaceae bacterium]
MIYTIFAPEKLVGQAMLPASKSISNRALVLHALAGGQMNDIHNLSDCDDTKVMIRALSEKNPETVDILAAGTAMRFLTAYFAATPSNCIITGTERMLQRPIGVLVEALRSLGADIEYTEKEGYPPLRIRGKALRGGSLLLPGNVSSQYISALLMIAPTLKEGLKITLTGKIISRPYLNLTLQLMHEFGAEAEWSGEAELTVKPKPYQAISYFVENDWSAASYWYQMVALSTSESEITLQGLQAKSFQGDSKVAELFEQLGVKTTFSNELEDSLQGGTLKLIQTGEVCSRMDYDFINQPDLAQTFVVTCALLNIPFHFTGLQSLKIKETDRIAALIAEMKKLGYSLSEANDSELFWNGERCEASFADDAIATYKDHRMAMAFAPATLRIPFLQINDPGVVSKSYPTYWEALIRLGFRIEAKSIR